jgi:light-regulated signal transduction histidine kinase (bacteriophytochrome)
VLEQLFAEQLGETGSFCINSICTASERMEELLDAMLLLSKISRSELKREEIDLSDLATIILSRMHMEEPERRVESVVEPGLKAVGDLGLLKSALENLLGNAWKYTRNKEVTRIEFGMTLGNGERTFYVRDNGAGFDIKDSEKMFLPFQRLHNEQEFEGTGIGLATVQRIIQRHGGKIWGEGEPGKGATFYFTLQETLSDSTPET